ncbi:MAG: amidophosphoribosyltransferase [Planctomycetes bacterium]|nr:amidophosphoribosyltransferase [Planctomycetota bacterium]
MCGYIGIYGPDGTDVAGEIYEGLLAVQHRGQDAAGIITFTEAFHVKKGLGLVLEIFNEKNMPRLRGNLGVGHVRYPTVGRGSMDDAQPFHLTFPVGVAMAHNGNVTNFQELMERHFKNSGTRMNSTCDVEVILFAFASALNERIRAGHSVTAEDVFAAVKKVYKDVRGAYSVVAVLPDVGLVAFRDPYGIKPCVFGEKTTSEGRWFACASESVVLDVNGYDRSFDLDAGEAVFVGHDRVVQRRKLSDKPHRPCIFELVYFARPDSFLDDMSVYKTRGRFGEALAQQWVAEKRPMPDAIIPVPDSSRDAALAMAMELGVPYREGLVKNRYIGRTFIMPNQSSRRTSIRRKLNPIPLEFEGKDVLLVDDSIVRGNTAARIVQMARDAGAKKVYLASCSPPLIAPCPYGIDMATKTEFVATNKTNDEIATELGVDGLIYLDREAMNAAARVGNPKIEKFCNACFTGEYPTGDITVERLTAIAGERMSARDEVGCRT